MSKPDEILSAVGSLLENDATLSGYVKNFFIGKRVQQVTFPAIAVQQISITETNLTFGTQELIMTIGVHGALQVNNKDIQIVGDGTTKGILDLENDIKKALSSDRFLSGKAVMMSILNSNYHDGEYPIKEVTIELEIQFRQNTFSRT